MGNFIVASVRYVFIGVFEKEVPAPYSLQTTGAVVEYD
jgi:hypothetical protein